MPVPLRDVGSGAWSKSATFKNGRPVSSGFYMS